MFEGVPFVQAMKRKSTQHTGGKEELLTLGIRELTFLIHLGLRPASQSKSRNYSFVLPCDLFPLNFAQVILPFLPLDIILFFLSHSFGAFEAFVKI